MIPLLLKPAVKEYLWGGTRLKKEFNKNTDLEKVAETWECSVHPDGMSIVDSGEFKGHTLCEVIEINPMYLGNKYSELKDLPIMIKFIDAAKDLSVQVHPDDEYARKFEGQNGKTEMWYILDAIDDAKLIYGFKDGISRDEFVDAVSNGNIMECLHQISINKGETYLIPAGTVHAIGAGTLVAEIQENSNVTYRLYDYDRIDKNGIKRELHLEKALEVIQFKSPKNSKMVEINNIIGEYSVSQLCKCEYFSVNKYEIQTKSSIFVGVESFQVILCTEGEADLMCGDNVLKLNKGNCVFLPAGIGRCTIEGKVELLNVIC